MTRQIEYANSLVGSRPEARFSRLNALTCSGNSGNLAVHSALWGSSPRRIQLRATSANRSRKRKPSDEPKEKMVGNYDDALQR